MPEPRTTASALERVGSVAPHSEIGNLCCCRFWGSAGEDVFAHRSVFPNVTETTSRRQAIVMSDDVELRRTVTGILNALNCECAALPMLIAEVRSHLDSCAGAVNLAVIDLDGPHDDIHACLALLRAESGIQQITGMSVYAASLENEARTTASQHTSLAVSRLIEKTELLPQLQEYLRFTA